MSGGNDVSLSVSSPTKDEFYDAGTTLTATTDYTWGLVDNDTRQNLLSFTLDSVTTNVTRQSSGTFTTTVITFTGQHTLIFNSVTQYLVGFQFKDSTGLDTISPTSVEIQVDDTYNRRCSSFRDMAGQRYHLPAIQSRVGGRRRDAY